MSETWKIFRGTGQPHQGILSLPAAPPWRRFSSMEGASFRQYRGATFQVGEHEVELVNAALYLRRPILVTGRPGTGKTSLAYAIAYELQLGEVLYWPINTRTSLADGLYRYDAISRLQDAQIGEELGNIGSYLQLGPLGTAFLPNSTPRVLLVDEIDKSDIDLPNDLLVLFEEGRFDIPELARIADRVSCTDVQTYDNQKASIRQGKVECIEFPLVVLTSNGERDFSPAFLRRCLQLEIPQPTIEQLERIVQSHFGLDDNTLERAKELIRQFVYRRDSGQNLATDQLLNVIFMLIGKKHPSETDQEILLSHLLQPLGRVRGEEM